MLDLCLVVKRPVCPVVFAIAKTVATIAGTGCCDPILASDFFQFFKGVFFPMENVYV